MSVVTAAKKNGEICIASDGQTSFGSTIVTGDHYRRSTKLFEIGDSVIGFVGWCSIEIVIEHLIITKPEIFKLNSRIEIFDTLLKLQKLLEEGYFVRTSDGELDQPVESNQITGLIVNRSGLYKIVADRAVFEFKHYWAIGSGYRYALGAMNALYAREYSAKTIAEAGVNAAMEYDNGCGLPVHSRMIILN